MAAKTSKPNKRKSIEADGESTEQMLKKVKVAKSAERPQPTKSALKKADDVAAKTPAVLDNAKKAAKKGAKAEVPKDELAAKKSEGKTVKSKAAASKEEVVPKKAADKSAKSKASVLEDEVAAEETADKTTKTKAQSKKTKTKDATEGTSAVTKKAPKVKDSAESNTATTKKATKNKDTTESTSATTKKATKSKDAADNTPVVAMKATKSKAKTVEEELVDSDDEEDAGTALTADQTAALMAGFESSDEDEDDDEEGIPLADLPKAPIDSAQADAAADAAKALSIKDSDPEKTPGVVYIGRIPHGFFEKQMKAYFSQFGEITHLRLARNKKTKKSMHYAFVEFASSAVAEIVAKTMNKYLMFNHILQVRTVPREQVKENIWNGESKRKKPMPLNRIEGARLNRGSTKEGWEKRIQRETKKRGQNAAKLAELGYEYDAPVLKGLGEEKSLESVDEPKAIEAKPAKAESNTGKKRSAVAPETTKKSKKNKTKA